MNNNSDLSCPNELVMLGSHDQPTVYQTDRPESPVFTQKCARAQQKLQLQASAKQQAIAKARTDIAQKVKAA